ncbi:hypothetical protein [Pedobacter gandavensis]|uniref:Dyp-type peroxidase n=1 Tax=Pedobacter gandavensis TaxID=2679963 RepID=UPI00292CD722|nr:hypothetical protein [Pedobacter gandavensis]
MSTINQSPSPQLSNIQGMVIRGFTHPFSCHMIFKFQDKDKTGAKKFTKAIYPYVQSADNWGLLKPDMMVNIGFTFSGISTVSDLSKNELGAFPTVFKNGPTSNDSQLSLNDLGESDPGKWVFGSEQKPVDCIVHCYALSDEHLQRLVSIVKQAADDQKMTEYFPINNGSQRLEEYATNPRNSIHFGYMDGIDQPDLKPDDPLDDSSSLGNFLIGFVPGSDPGPPPATAAGIFAKDGCYNAFRMLAQDVKCFDDFLEEQALVIAPKLNRDQDYAKEWLAAKLNGRWLIGSPLELSPEEPDPDTVRSTDFDYTNDLQGKKCPFAAHNRVSNPRSDPLKHPGPIPRLIRRGMAYGAPVVLKDYHGERGLIGLFLCGSLDIQFELIYSWINATNFNTLKPKKPHGQDALIANRGVELADTSFSIPLENGQIEIKKLPQFVTAKGTAYCILPSLDALKKIADLV